MKKIKLLFAAMLSMMAWNGVMAQITDVSQLSNAKVYSVTTERGAWWVDQSNGRMHYDETITNAADIPANDINYQFAFLKYDDHYYLYAPALKKFVQPQKYFVTGYSTPVILLKDGDKVKVKAENSSLTINIGGGQWTWDTWTATDGGNAVTIVEATDFDATEAIQILTGDTHFDTHKVFTISAERGYWTANDAGNALTSTPGEPNASEAKQQFAFYYDGPSLYIYNVGTDKFLKADGTLVASKGDPMDYRIIGTSGYDHMLFIPSLNHYFNAQNNGGFAINTWSTADAGNKQKLVEVENVDVYDKMDAFFAAPYWDVTYKVFCGDEQVDETVLNQTGGAEAALPPTKLYDYCTYTYEPTTITTGVTEVKVTATWNGPFEIANSYDNIKWYNLYLHRNSDWYFSYANTEPYHPTANATDKQRAADAFQWGFVGNPYKLKIYNKQTGSSMTLKNDNNVAMREGDNYWSVKVKYHSDGNKTGFMIGLPGDVDSFLNQYGGENETSYWGLWGSRADQGSALFVNDVPDIPVTSVYYDISFNGNPVSTYRVDGAEIGEAVPALPKDELARDFVSLEYETPEKVTADMHIPVTATWSGPFEIATDYQSAHWYDMSVRGNWYVTSDNKDDKGALKTVEANAMGLQEDAYQWAFVGDPWHLQLFNKAEGESKVYAWTSTDDASIPAFEDAATSQNYWQIKGSTASGYTNAFMLTIPNYGYQLNQNGGPGGPLKIWRATGTGDAGSAFKVFDVPTNFASYVVDEIAPAFEATGYFTFTDAAKATLGWDPAYKTECPFETYKSLKEKLAAVDATDLSQFVLPESGYYTLKNKNYSTYLGIDPSDANMYGNYANANAAKNVVQLTKTGDASYTISLMFMFAPATVEQSAQVTASTEVGTYTVSVPAVGFAAFQADTEAQYSALHCASGGSIVGWETAAAASLWAVEDASSIELPISEAGYATAYLPFPVAVPENVKAYTGQIKGKLALAEVTGTIPVATPVILEGAEGTYTFNFADDVAAIDDNDLKGSFEPIEAAGKYVLYKPENGEVGFYLADKGTIAVGKAYLELPSDTEVKAIFFANGDATGIANVEKTMENGAIYNVAGQRVNKALKGIYIVNGKKVVK